MKLNDSLTTIFRTSEVQKKALDRLGLKTVEDLLYYFPVRYGLTTNIKSISEAVEGESATFFGKISHLAAKKSFRGSATRGEASLTDLSGATIRLIWFHQPYLAKMLTEGSSQRVTGKVSSSSRGLYISNPEVSADILPIDRHYSLFQKNDAIKSDIAKSDTTKNGTTKNDTPKNSDTNLPESSETRRLVPENENFGYPVYAETRGLTSSWIYHSIQKIFQSGLVADLPDYIPEDILSEYKLPRLSTAIVWIHSPREVNDSTAARKRFAFEEIFLIQLKRRQDRLLYERNQSYRVSADQKGLTDFVKRFPFTLTGAQDSVLDTILKDLKREQPMARLLEGDVGSGKTAVAAAITYATVNTRPEVDNKPQDFGHLQVAYMAPTEILATQLFDSFCNYFAYTNVAIGLITGSGCRKFPSKVNPKLSTPISRVQLSKWMANGEIPIVIGTHALIAKSVTFKHLALVIVDEQHRFGIRQRGALAKKAGFAPHFLSMTATPIPRTLALTIYGDLDLTLLDQMPAGRKPVITKIIAPDKRQLAYASIQEEMKTGRQLYVICPRIAEPDPDKEHAINAKSVTAEAARLKREVFKEANISVLHGKLTRDVKEKIMTEFSAGKTDILVATSVVEVGVNVPNATMIIIEGAERFGLAQLHQLRGRVIRSTHQAYCYIFAETKSAKTMNRLKAVESAKNGFELAEMDLALRGSGELSGRKQWGISDLGMEAIKNIKMVEAARSKAQEIITTDPDLLAHPSLALEMERRTSEAHFE